MEQVTGKIVRTITLVMISHADKDMSPKMTSGTSIAGNSKAILCDVTSTRVVTKG